MDRTPPASEEAERALIGAALTDPKLFVPLTAIVSSDDFFLPHHEEIWCAMLALQAKRRALDIVSVEDEIRTRNLKRLEPGYLIKCVNEPSVLYHAEHYARLVREKATLRKVIAACAEVQSAAYGDVGNAVEFMRDSVTKVAQAALADVSVQTETIEETGQRILSTLERSEKGEIVVRIPTGIAQLDAVLDGGVRLGYYMVPIAQTSIGKSSFARQVLFRAAKERGIPGLLFSLEDGREDALVAGAANLARIDNRLFAPRTPTTIPPDNMARWRTIDGALSTAVSLGELVRIETHRHIGQIVAISTAWRARHKGPAVIVVDQISKVRGTRKKSDNREQEVAGVSQALFDLSKDLGVVVIAPAQLTDEARRERRRPSLGDSRESRAIEHDADIVLGIHRQRRSLNEPCDLAVLKHRGGALGTARVMWRGSWNGFETPTTNEEREMEAE